MITGLFVACLSCAIVPALLFCVNLRLYRRAPEEAESEAPAVSVLIPARNEELTIETAVRAVLDSARVEVECVVLDDDSSDRTAAIVRELGRADSRVRLLAAPPLPEGWCGKQHACHVLSGRARHDVLCFVDADVRLSPDAIARMCAFLQGTGASLVSGFPRQQTETWLERLLLPLIHFVLLGFLPVARMRRSVSPAYAAACGQLIMVKRADYDTAGGHQAIRASLHDGLQLPRVFRRAGFRTDIFDATDTAVCRMYRNAREVWNGLAKNATEGMGAPGRIVPLSSILLLGQVMPFVLAVWYPAFVGPALLAWLPRFLAVKHFHQPMLSALLHPLGVSLLLAIQWYALGRKVLRIPAGWRDRAYVSP